MQPTEQQVQRSLAALRAAGPGPLRGGDEGGGDDGGGDDGGATLDDVPIEALTRLDQAPRIRVDRLEQARRRLASGDGPTAEDVAGRMVDRFVCDRLR